MSLAKPAQHVLGSNDGLQLRSHRKRLLLILTGLFVLAAIIRWPMLNLRFDRNSEASGAFCAIQARNFVQMGILRTHLVPVQSVGISSRARDHPTPYPNHPPLAPLMVAASYKCFGIGQWQTRLPPALFTLGCMGMVFILLRHRAGLRAATLAAVLFAVVPISVRYGGQPDVIGAQLVFFILLTVAGYLRWQDKPGLANFALLAIPFALAAATDWPAFFICPVLAVHFCATRRPRRWLPMVCFAIFCTALLLGLYAHLSIAAHDWGLIPRNFLRRSVQDQSDNAGIFGWKRWFSVAVMGRNVADHTAVILFLALAWCAQILWKIIRPKSPNLPPPFSGGPEGRAHFESSHMRKADLVTTLLLAWGILHVLVGRQGTFVHDWWWWPLTPGLAMAAALAIDRALQWYEKRRPASASIARRLTIIAVAAFSIVTVVRTIRPFYLPANIYGKMPAIPGPRYTTAELGAAIRAAAPANSEVVLAENDDEPSIWFYGDRPLIMNVWDPVTLQKRIQRGMADLPYRYWQSWSPVPVACIVPRQYQTQAAPLLAFLREKKTPIRLPAQLDQKFWAFDLRAPQVSKP